VHAFLYSPSRRKEGGDRKSAEIERMFTRKLSPEPGRKKKKMNSTETTSLASNLGLCREPKKRGTKFLGPGTGGGTKGIWIEAAVLTTDTTKGSEGSGPLVFPGFRRREKSDQKKRTSLYEIGFVRKPRRERLKREGPFFPSRPRGKGGGKGLRKEGGRWRGGSGRGGGSNPGRRVCP